jgi:hypothetical protein
LLPVRQNDVFCGYTWLRLNDEDSHSIPDAIFARSESFARAKRLSRSELFTRAVEAYMEAASSDALTQAYDKAFDDRQTPDRANKADPSDLVDTGGRTLLAVEWQGLLTKRAKPGAKPLNERITKRPRQRQTQKGSK